MPDSPLIVALCGSLRDDSHTRTSLECALAGAAQRGADTELLDLRRLDIPIYDADQTAPGDVDELRDRIQEADAIILGTPLYHGSYASPLKTALDYCGFDEFEQKTVGLLAVSGGSFPITALDHLRAVCRALDAWVLPYQAAVPTASSAIEDGSFVDEELEERVTVLGRRVVDYARIEPDPSAFESEENVGASD